MKSCQTRFCLCVFFAGVSYGWSYSTSGSILTSLITHSACTFGQLPGGDSAIDPIPLTAMWSFGLRCILPAVDQPPINASCPPWIGHCSLHPVVPVFNCRMEYPLSISHHHQRLSFIFKELPPEGRRCIVIVFILLLQC